MNYKLPPLPEIAHHYWHSMPAYSPEQMQAYAIAAIEAQGVPDGWQLVPKEPTVSMARALLDYPESDEELPWPKSISPNFALAAYRIMLASAPPAPQVKPDRTGMTYYKNNACKAPNADHPDCICWTQAPQAAVVQQEPLSREEREVVVSSIRDGCDLIHAGVMQQEPVAYLDIGAVGYIDLGSDQSIEKLQSLPVGRHMLGIIGTFGASGYVPAQQAKPLYTPISDEQIRSAWKAWNRTSITSADRAVEFVRSIFASDGIKE